MKPRYVKIAQEPGRTCSNCIAESRKDLCDVLYIKSKNDCENVIWKVDQDEERRTDD